MPADFTLAAAAQPTAARFATNNTAETVTATTFSVAATPRATAIGR